jgi:transposase
MLGTVWPAPGGIITGRLSVIGSHPKVLPPSLRQRENGCIPLSELRRWRLRRQPTSSPENGMHLKTILNRVYHHPGFVYSAFKFTVESSLKMWVTVKPRRGSLPICSGCNCKGPGYDTLAERYFEFIPLWGILVFFLYSMRRVDCPRCGVTVETVPWANGKSTLTKAYAYFLATWAKRMSWAEVARAFDTTWESVFRSVKMVVAWGLAHRSLHEVRSIGVDEVLWLRGKFLTVVYQIDEGTRRLLWIGRDRTVKTMLRFFRQFGRERATALRFVCSDMWQPYLKVIAKKAKQAFTSWPT